MIQMKSTTGLLLLVVLLAGCQHAEIKQPASSSSPSPTPPPPGQPVFAANVEWKTVEEFDYVGNPALSPTHFKLELPAGYGDPGDFLRIHIQVKGQPDFVVDNSDGWVEYNIRDEPSDVYKHLQGRNLVPSKHVLVLPASLSPSEPPLVLLRSWGYASNPERLHIIGFQNNGKPVLLFNQEFELIEFADLDGDGYAEIVGRPCLGEGLGEDFVTYTPIQVYKVLHPINGTARLSVPLSKRYSLQHSYGWAGPDCDETMLVVRHPPGGGKPVILPEVEARKLMEGGSR
jgi:hypothetical protein